MFTGLVETVGVVRSLERSGPSAELRLTLTLGDIAVGDSVAVNGACLTAIKVHDDGVSADVSSETLAVTTLGELRAGNRVNVERASRLGDRMGGHVVLGHVDGVGRVRTLEPSGEAKRLVVEVPAALDRYLADKGSVAIDGISLTVNRLAPPHGIELMLVPHTLAQTTLLERSVGDAVNVEVDVLARYVARQLEHAGLIGAGEAAADARLMQLLRSGGYAD